MLGHENYINRTYVHQKIIFMNLIERWQNFDRQPINHHILPDKPSVELDIIAHKIVNHLNQISNSYLKFLLQVLYSRVSNFVKFILLQ